MSYEDLFIRKGIRDKNYRFSNQSYTSALANNNRRELVFKVASDIKNVNPNSPAQSIEYITRDTPNHDDDEFIEPENELGQKLDREEARELAQNWKDEFSHETRKNARVMTHYVLSIDEKLADKKLRDFEAATRDFLRERFGDDGYRYAFVIHNDTERTHAHIMVNNFNRERDRKLRMDKQWFFETRLMAKEHLQQHGFEYEATLRKDRKHLDRMRLDTENELKAVNNWFDAKLKSVSENDKHFELILTHRKALRKARQAFEAAPHSQEEAANFRASLQQTRAAMLDYDQYANRTEANYQVADVLKRSGITAKQLKDSKDHTRIAALTDRDIQQTARDLVRSEIAVELSSGLETGERKKLLADIKERQKTIGKHTDIDFGEMKKQMLRTKTMSPEYAKYSGILRKEEKVIKAVNFDGANAEKQLYRLFDETHKAKDLPVNEKALVDERVRHILTAYEQKGVDVKQLETRWQAQRLLKDEIADLQISLKESRLNPELAQKRVIAAREKIKDVALSRKDQIQMGRGLDDRQATIDKITFSGRDKVSGSLQRQLNNINQVDVKRAAGKEKEADRQLFAISKSYLDLKADAVSLTADQKATLAPDFARMEKALTKRGVNITHLMKQRNVSHGITRNVTTMKEINQMDRSRVEDLSKVITLAKDTQKEINRSDLNPNQKRQTRSTIRDQVNQASDKLELRRVEFEQNLKQMRELSDKAVSLSKQQDQSPMAVMHRRRELESLDRDFDKLAKRVRADLPLAGSASQQLNVRRNIEQMEKAFGQNRGWSR